MSARFEELSIAKFRVRAQVNYVFRSLDDLPAGFAPPEGRSKPWGTGHASLSARNEIHEPFAVINADDFYGRPAYEGMANALSRAVLDSTEFYLAGLSDTLSNRGAVSRGMCEVGPDGLLRRVVERTHIERRAGAVLAQSDAGLLPIAPDTTVSMNFWVFTPALFSHLEQAFAGFFED